MPMRKLTRLRAGLMEHLWARGAARSLHQTIRRVRPDVIWIIPHDFSVFPLAEILNEQLRKTDNKKIRVHVTIQDFPDCHGHGKLWGQERVQRIARMQEAIYARADTADATSHPMLEELERRTGKRGIQMLHQGLEPEDFAYLESRLANPQPSSPDPRPSIPIKIAYAGTILCEPEFARFVEMLSTLASRLSPPGLCPTPSSVIQFQLFSAHSYRDRPWFNPSWMIEHGHLPERELLAELRKCDFGFIPMSLQDDDPRYNRFSFPTKFITYLAAGLVPIVMGHPESSVMKMATAYNVGLTIQSHHPSLDDLSKALLSPDAKTACLSQILRCARQEFDADKMRRTLWKSLRATKDAELTMTPKWP